MMVMVAVMMVMVMVMVMVMIVRTIPLPPPVTYFQPAMALNSRFCWKAPDFARRFDGSAVQAATAQ